MGYSGLMEMVSLPDEGWGSDTRPKTVCSVDLETPLPTVFHFRTALEGKRVETAKIRTAWPEEWYQTTSEAGYQRFQRDGHGAATSPRTKEVLGGQEDRSQIVSWDARRKDRYRGARGRELVGFVVRNSSSCWMSFASQMGCRSVQTQVSC